MTHLLDTHGFIWFCDDEPILSSLAKSLLEDPANEILFSVASCWEMAIKAGLGKLDLHEPSASYVCNALARTGFKLLPITIDHATAVEHLPHHHRDPFDRMLVVQAFARGIPIISNDTALDAYGVTRLW